MANFNAWYDVTIGEHIDVDKAFGDQCVDMAMSWAIFCFPPHNWPELIGFGNAKDLYRTANSAYFDKIQYSPGFVARQGDMPVYGATPTNAAGHIAVVGGATASEMQVIEQNGFDPEGVAYTTNRSYNNLVGLLRPKQGDNVHDLTEAQYDALARRVLSLGMFLTVDGSAPDRQPTAKEVTDVINGLKSDPIGQLDYLMSTTPYGAAWNKVKHYDEVAGGDSYTPVTETLYRKK